MIGHPRGIADGAVAAIVFLVAFWLGGAYVSKPDVAASARYYQETMAPSVMLACGRGLVNADKFQREDPGAGRALHAFLAREADRFDCATLPPQVRPEGLTALQDASRYLLVAVAGAWTVSGVSWSGMWWFFGLLYGLVGVTAYFAFRAFASWPMAALLTMVLVTSPTQLGNLPHLRDYSKAPFFMGMLLITARLVRRTVTTRALFGWCVAAGVLMGLSVGVRFDMLLFLFFFVPVVLLFLPGSIREHAPARLAAAAACIIVSLVVAAPVLQSFRLGNNSWHVIALGLSTPHDDALQIQSANYDLGVLYNDSHVAAVVNGYWSNTHPGTPVALLESAQYLREAGAYVQAVVWTFPADIALRAWAAVLRVAALPFTQAAVAVPSGRAGDALGALVSARFAVSQQLGSVAPWIPLVAAIGLAYASVRLSLLATAALVFFGGYSSLQFQERHVFHLEVLPLSMLGLAAEWTLSTALAAIRGRGGPPSNRGWGAGAIRVGLVGGGLVVFAVLPLLLLRMYQDHRVGELFTRYNAAVTGRDRPPPQAQPSGALRFYPGPPETPANTPLTAEFLAADFSAADCDFDRVPVMVRYETNDPTMDFSRPFNVSIPDRREAVTRVFLTAYDYREPARDTFYRFAGLEMSAGQAGCLHGLVRVEGRAGLPLLVDAQLSPAWQDEPRHKTLRGLEGTPVAQPVAQYVFPPQAEFRRSQLAGALLPLGVDAETTAPIVSFGARGRVGVSGRPASASGYLAAWRPADQPAGALFVAEGELAAGAFAVGLERDRQWAALVPVTVPGRFRIVIQVPDGAPYGPVIASHDPLAHRVDFVIERIGWIR